MRADWEDPVAAYLTWLRASGVSAGTVRLRHHQLRMFSRGVECGPWECTDDMLARYVAGSECAAETRSSNRAAVRGFYRWAVETRRTEHNPARSLRAVRVPPGRPRPTPEHVVEEALAAASPRDALMISLAAYAGLRCTEIAGLRLDDIDSDEITVRGKGGYVRAVPLHPVVKATIEAELRRRAGGVVGAGHRYAVRGDGGWLFPGQRDHLTANSVSRVLSRLLSGKWTGHTLRHRFGSAAYAHTRDLRTVQTLLGHARPEATARYTAIPDGALYAAVLAAGPPRSEADAA